MIFGIEPTKVDFFLGHHGPPHFFSTWKKWTPQPKFHRLNSDLLGTCQGPHWQGTACAFAWVPYLGAWVSGSKPDQTVETQNQKCDKNLQKTTKKTKGIKRRCFFKSKSSCTILTALDIARAGRKEWVRRNQCVSQHICYEKMDPCPYGCVSNLFCVQFMAVCEKMMFSTSQWPDLGGVAISDQLTTPSRNWVA